MLQQCLIALSNLLPEEIYFSEISQTSIKTQIYTGFVLNDHKETLSQGFFHIDRPSRQAKLLSTYKLLWIILHSEKNYKISLFKKITAKISDYVEKDKMTKRTQAF